MNPVKDPVRLTSGYGVRTDPITGKPGQFHPGLDLVSDSGDRTLIACADGVVIDSKHDYDHKDRWNLKGKNTVGNRMVVKSEIAGKTYFWTYYHTEVNNTNNGDHITKGQPIGTYGDVGYSAGAHVHLQCWDYDGFYNTGVPIDPTFLLTV